MPRDLVGHLSAQKGWECRSPERYVDYWLWVLMAFTMKSWEVSGMLIHCTSLHSGRKRKRILPHTTRQVHLLFGPSPLTSLSGDHLLTSAVHLSYTHAMTFDSHNPYLKSTRAQGTSDFSRYCLYPYNMGTHRKLKVWSFFTLFALFYRQATEINSWGWNPFQLDPPNHYWRKKLVKYV